MPSTDRSPADSGWSSSGPASTRFTAIDWDAVGTTRWRPDAPTRGLLVAFAAIAVTYGYDYVVAPEELIAFLKWNPTRVDWLTLVAGVLLVRYGVVPLLVDRRRGRRVLGALARRPAGALSLAYLLVFVVVGIIGPDAFFTLEYPRLQHKLQPPALTHVNTDPFAFHQCLGRTAGEVCHGTLKYPLGTNRFGQNMLRLVMHGMRIALQLGLSAAMIMVVFATAVGAVAGFYGGRVDAALMGYVDFQRAVPAILVYLVLSTMFLGGFEGVSDGRMLSLILVFGLLNWGGMARLVRSDVLKQRSKGYVRAARSAGATDGRILRRHVVPNAKATVVTSLTRRIPLLILAQVALAYLNVNRVDNQSLGRVLRFAHVGNQLFGGDFQIHWHQKWWVSAFPLLFLGCTVLAFNFIGDVARDLQDVQS